VRFLAQEWFDRFAELGADLPIREGLSLRVNQQVSGGPEGDVKYAWVLEEGRIVSVSSGHLPDAEVSLLATYDDTVAMQRGTLDMNEAFMQGRVKVTGNMAKVMGFLPMASSTDYRRMIERLAAESDY
jgi:putative sterol carrier protein